MASLLNNASLLLNPAGSIISYQEDKIYSVLPNNGAGDFTFSGGDGGTRVNQQGYIETTPANLFTYSNSFTTGPDWFRNGTTLTSGQSDPFGGTNAWKVDFAAGSSYLFGYSNPRTTGVVTISAYLRADSPTTIGFNDGYANPNSITIGTTWQRYTFTYTVSVSGATIFSTIQFDNYFGVSPSGQTKSFYLYGAQLNIGSTAKPYQPTTDRLNYPRITYQNGRGALLSEPQRTNLTQGSNGLTTNWTNYRGTYTANAIMSPDGTMNAPLTVWDGSSASTVGFYFTNFSFTGSTTYCFSVFLKYYNKPVVTVGYVDRSGPYLGGGASFNLANGTFVGVSGDATTGIIEPYKDGWYRCTVVFTTVASPSYNYLQIDCDVDTAGEGFYVYGCQLEIGEFPTSYIPTTSATVTRPADIASDTNAASLIGQSAGTVYFDFTLDNLYSNAQTNQPVLWYMKDGGVGERYVQLINGNRLYYIEYNGGVIADISSPAINAGRHKCAIAYANNDMVFYVDGVQVGIDGSGTPNGYSTVSTQYYNSTYYGQCKVHSLAPYNSRLTNTQLAELTTVRSGSGGNISYYGPYTIHTFTGSATFTPSFSGEVEVLVVAGGGGGGFDFGGGGGAGGLLYASSYGVAQGTGITVTIGGGGVGGPPAGQSTSGGNSAFGGLTAIGGGGGANGSGANVYGLVKNGGSGGGAGGWSNALRTVSGSGIPGQGFDGGIGDPSTTSGGAGGGGGAGQKGQDSIGLSPAGDGGDGLPYSITGFSTYYAGGGGGGTYPDTSIAGVGGNGGGGNGAAGISVNGYAATSYTGGGGGGNSGGGGGSGGNGGSGIVIVRYLT